MLLWRPLSVSRIHEVDETHVIATLPVVGATGHYMAYVVGTTFPVWSLHGSCGHDISPVVPWLLSLLSCHCCDEQPLRSCPNITLLGRMLHCTATLNTVVECTVCCSAFGLTKKTSEKNERKREKEDTHSHVIYLIYLLFNGMVCVPVLVG